MNGLCWCCSLECVSFLSDDVCSLLQLNQSRLMLSSSCTLHPHHHRSSTSRRCFSTHECFLIDHCPFFFILIITKNYYMLPSFSFFLRLVFFSFFFLFTSVCCIKRERTKEAPLTQSQPHSTLISCIY